MAVVSFLRAHLASMHLMDLPIVALGALGQSDGFLVAMTANAIRRLVQVDDVGAVA